MKVWVAVAALCFFPGCKQDVKGDWVIGVPLPAGTVIETYGSTSLVQAGNNFFLQPASGSAVELTYGGSPVVDSEFSDSGSPWKPIAAEQTATGFEVAWKAAGADKYTVWCTDANGNYVFSAFTVATGSSVTLESLEASFHQDLDGDGVVGANTSGLGDQPRFVYRGTDSAGAQLYRVNWDTLGSHPFAVRVLTPTHPSSAYPHSFLFALPVQPGLAQSNWGSGLDELGKLDVEDQYNTTIIEPIFPKDSWYADNPKNPTIDYETFVASSLPQWVHSIFSTTENDNNVLIGFSKSGFGAMDLLFKHQDTFDAAAVFDFPADMASYDYFGPGSSVNYGTEENFRDNYQLTDAFIKILKTQFTKQNRVFISMGPIFSSQMADFDAMLTSQGVAHTFSIQTNAAHNWYGGWLPDAVAGLFGLEKNLNAVASASLARRPSRVLKKCPASPTETAASSPFR